MLNLTSENLADLYKTGVYLIHCFGNDTSYIGSARHPMDSSTKTKSKRGFYRRWLGHISTLTRQKHRNSHLQRSWNKYGPTKFKFYILEFTNEKDTLLREEYWLYLFKEKFKLFNVKFKPHSTKGYKSNKKSNLKNKNTGVSRPLALKKALGKSVLVYDLNNNFIEEVYSMTEAAKKYNTCRQNIRKVCLGLNPQTKGYIYKYKS